MGFATFGAKDAKACGGCFHEPNENDSPVTAHRMIISVSPTQSTLYDQIQYVGSPSSFAWVLPIHGTVDVGLSADVVFGTLDTLTQTQVLQPQANCPAAPTCGDTFNAAPQAGAASADAGAGGVTVLKQQVVGPYATVQLAATDPMALNTWLTQNGYLVPSSVQPIVAAYVNEGFGFLALKLVPGANVQSMRPVRVTTPGAGVDLPLRMVAAGTGATVGITLWVLSDGRYEPQNFPWFHIDDSQIVWDWSTTSSNYKTLRAQNEQSLGGRGWEVESSLSLSQYNVTNVVLNGGASFGGPGGAPAANDYEAATLPDGGAGTADQARMDDMATLFAGITMPNVRVTRLRSDLAHSALDQDLTLQASMDQSELSNIRTVSQQVNEPQCPIYGSDCGIIGYGPRGQGGSAGNGASGGTGSSFDCSLSPRSTKAAEPPVEGTLTFAVIVGFIGIAAMRSRRRRDEE